MPYFVFARVFKLLVSSVRVDNLEISEGAQYTTSHFEEDDDQLPLKRVKIEPHLVEEQVCRFAQCCFKTANILYSIIIS